MGSGKGTMKSSIMCGMSIIGLICLVQTIGYVTPAWFCNKESTPTATFIPLLNRTVIPGPNTESDTCDIQGLYYPGGIKDVEVFCLSTVSMIGVWICTGMLLVMAVRKSEEECVVITCCVILAICQCLAGVAGLILIHRYDKLGWSAYMFMSVGVAFVFLIFAIIYLIYHILQG